MKKYLPHHAALTTIRILVLLLCTLLSIAARIYLVSFEILMTVLICLFWTIGILFAFLIMPGYFRRTVVYISSAEITLHTGMFFKLREYMRMSAVQYVTNISFPLSKVTGFNFVLIRGLGGTIVLPFLKAKDAKEITDLLNVKIQEQ